MFIISKELITTNDHGYIIADLPKPVELRNSEFDTVIRADIKYTGFPKGTKLRITIEEIE